MPTFPFNLILLRILETLGATLPYWLAPLMVFVVFRLWRLYTTTRFISKLEWVLLEIKLPREIRKGPKAMEMVLEAFHDTADPNFLDKYWKGQVRKWGTLEMVSFGGQIRFFVRVLKVNKFIIEPRIYSQYPGVEIVEVEDYTDNVPFTLTAGDWDMFGMELDLSKPDPYPIKTYIDYGLDKDDEEDFKVDPITPLIELMGSLAPKEVIWVQFLVVAAYKRFKKPGTWFGRQDWKAEGERLVNEILKRDPKTKGTSQLSPAGFPVIPSLSKGEEVVVTAIERGLAKFGFDCGIRVLYMSPKTDFNKSRVGGLISSFKQFSSQNLNGLKTGFITVFKYPFQDPFGSRALRRKRLLFNAYRARSYFFPPYPRKRITLNTEELATLFHFPGKVSETPTFARIQSKRSEPPPNLPI